ncbi:MAG: SGNH/GDSL hydrolase family protein [Victivallales bacterium]|nr:SGNH/GDSL hydrolase family protein [Victivallales bacterium]
MLRILLVLLAATLITPASGDPMLTVDSMPRVLFTGDSQTCGRNLGIDFPQLLEPLFPMRVINTAVGGSNSSALLRAMTGGTIRIAKGDRVLHGVKVRWGMGPFPGQGITVSGQRYTIDFIDEHPGTPDTEIHLVEAAVESYEGKDYAIDPGWDHRVARWQPDVVVLMYINDGTMPPNKREDWREMIRRIRSMGAVPVLMSPIPVDDARQGGNHPGDNHRRVAQNAAAIRGIAESEKCWFVDVYHLTFALDPVLRTIIQDGIHPDTDGQTVILDGLSWVFREMGLPTARPFIKGWQIDEPAQALAPDHPGVPLRTAQPDHPNPKRQLTEGFSVAAFRRWDEYGLLARPDGHSLPFAKSLLLRVGAAEDETPTHLQLKGTGIRQVLFPVGGRLVPGPMESDKAGLHQVTLPAGAVVDDAFRVVLESDGDGGIDWFAVRTNGPDTPKWKAPDNQYREYRVEADHTRAGNLVTNPGCRTDDAWELAEGTVFNRAFTREVGPLGFVGKTRGRLATLGEPGPARAYDTLRVTGSALGNNGAFRIRQKQEDGRFVIRRRNKDMETGLAATLEHSDGCPLVPGDSCIELPSSDAAAEQQLVVPAGTKRLRISFFHRVWDDQRLGTRDVPTAPARVVLSGAGFSREFAAPPSFQWRKFTTEIPAPVGKLTLRLLGRPDGRQLFTGFAIHAVE